MSHLATALFFALVLTGAVFAITLTLKEYWAEILAALKGEVPVRRPHRRWSANRVRATVRPRPAVAGRATPQRHVAA